MTGSFVAYISFVKNKIYLQNNNFSDMKQNQNTLSKLVVKLNIFSLIQASSSNYLLDFNTRCQDMLFAVYFVPICVCFCLLLSSGAKKCFEANNFKTVCCY